MRHPSGATARDVVAGCLKTFARAGKSGAAPASPLWAGARNAVGSQAAETGRAVGGRVSEVLGRVARSPGRVLGKDEQASRQERKEVTRCVRSASRMQL